MEEDIFDFFDLKYPDTEEEANAIRNADKIIIDNPNGESITILQSDGNKVVHCQYDYNRRGRDAFEIMKQENLI